MRRLLRVTPVLLMIIASTAASAFAQESGEGEQEPGRFTLEQNYPNPFQSDTRIPFILDDGYFDEEGDERPVVSMRVYNLIRQPVAVAVTVRHPEGRGINLTNLEYPEAGRYEGYWDGRDFSGSLVAPGTYWVQLTVNGVSKAKKMIVSEQSPFSGL